MKPWQEKSANGSDICSRRTLKERTMKCWRSLPRNNQLRPATCALIWLKNKATKKIRAYETSLKFLFSGKTVARAKSNYFLDNVTTKRQPRWWQNRSESSHERRGLANILRSDSPEPPIPRFPSPHQFPGFDLSHRSYWYSKLPL